MSMTLGIIVTVSIIVFNLIIFSLIPVGIKKIVELKLNSKGNKG